MNKKTWKTPRLLVLVRSNPEEAVLLSCKLSDVRGPKSFVDCNGEGSSGGEPCEQWVGS